MTQTTTEILKSARALITPPENWIKGDYYNADKTCFCAVGAVAAVTDSIEHYGNSRPEEVLKATAHLSNVASERMGWDDGRRTGHPVLEYNDRQSTTHEDVLSLFDEAITRSEA